MVQLSTFKAVFFKALAHPLRISILDALRDGELTVNEISHFSFKSSHCPVVLYQAILLHRNNNIYGGMLLF